jgi:hypothetical protein
MEARTVACLRCGHPHRLSPGAWRCLQESECPCCGYVGWTPVKESRLAVAANGRRLRLIR